MGQGNCIDRVGRCGMSAIYMAQKTMISNCGCECMIRRAAEGNLKGALILDSNSRGESTITMTCLVPGSGKTSWIS